MNELKLLIKKVDSLNKEISDLTDALESKKVELKHYIETVLPDIFMNENISKITVDGRALRLSTNYFVSFKDQEKAIEWFEKQGLGEIFKRDVVVHCPSDEYKNLLTTQLALSDYDYKFSHHWKAMSAQIARLVEDGIDIPDFIGMSQVNKVLVGD